MRHAPFLFSFRQSIWRVTLAAPTCEEGTIYRAPTGALIKKWIARLCATLKEFFVGVELAVFGSVVEGNVAVGALFELVDFAGVERLGVNVDADGTLIVFGKIEDLVDGFEGIDVDGIRGIHFIDVGGDEFAGAGVVCGSVAIFNAEILDF